MKIYKKNFLPLVLISTSAIIPTITSLTTTSHGSKKLGTKLNSDKDDIKQEVGNWISSQVNEISQDFAIVSPTLYSSKYSSLFQGIQQKMTDEFYTDSTVDKWFNSHYSKLQSWFDSNRENFWELAISFNQALDNVSNFLSTKNNERLNQQFFETFVKLDEENEPVSGILYNLLNFNWKFLYQMPQFMILNSNLQTEYSILSSKKECEEMNWVTPPETHSANPYNGVQFTFTNINDISMLNFNDWTIQNYWSSTPDGERTYQTQPMPFLSDFQINYQKIKTENNLTNIPDFPNVETSYSIVLENLKNLFSGKEFDALAVYNVYDSFANFYNSINTLTGDALLDFEETLMVPFLPLFLTGIPQVKDYAKIMKDAFTSCAQIIKNNFLNTTLKFNDLLNYDSIKDLDDLKYVVNAVSNQSPITINSMYKLNQSYLSDWYDISDSLANFSTSFINTYGFDNFVNNCASLVSTLDTSFYSIWPSYYSIF